MPPSRRFVEAECASLLALDGVRVFPAVPGWWFGAPTLRKRLFVGKGFDLSAPAFAQESDVGLRRALPYLGADLYVKNEVTNTRTPGGGLRRYRPERGEAMRSVGLPSYAARASNRNQLWRRVGETE